MTDPLAFLNIGRLPLPGDNVAIATHKLAPVDSVIS
jgi:hypothetical protein